MTRDITEFINIAEDKLSKGIQDFKKVDIGEEKYDIMINQILATIDMIKRAEELLEGSQRPTNFRKFLGSEF